MFLRITLLFISLVFLNAAVMTAEAQTRKKKPSVKKPAAAAPTPTPKIKIEQPVVEVSTKRNERPSGDVQPTASSPSSQKSSDPFFRYEFTQPDFINDHIIIEHDEHGIGKISFSRRSNDEMFSEPITVSAAALRRLNDAFSALNFLDSTEEYQDKRDYSHLGVVRIVLKREGRERTVTYNFTLNKNAKNLADEYRRIANQAIWIFDITISRANQRLETPSQMVQLESLIKRNEISDMEQMMPFLNELADDERLPLIARNHATRIIKQIEKAKK
ncbi:MAG: hypothetical protein ACRD6X_10640 [Pyrinomonadaceae bacterium]